MLDSLVRLRAALDKLETAALLAMLAALLCLSLLQVALRQAHIGLAWADVLIRHFVLWIGMTGAVLAASRSRHIRIDAIGRVLPPRAFRMVGMGLDAISAWICLRLALASRDFVAMTQEFGDLAEPLAWPAWPLQSIIPVAFALMALHFLINLPLRSRDPLSADTLPLVEDEPASPGPAGTA